ncbi:hypothetical protein [Rhodopseudomonas faecalis]|nr:hypothetical protein [Rhodopseudomonas faecalis]
MPYNVFVSHGWHDRWIARQMASSIVAETGAQVLTSKAAIGLNNVSTPD